MRQTEGDRQRQGRHVQTDRQILASVSVSDRLRQNKEVIARSKKSDSQYYSYKSKVLMKSCELELKPNTQPLRTRFMNIQDSQGMKKILIGNN